MHLLLAAALALSVSDVDAIWNDPVFQRQFIAAYGFQAEVEPRVTPDEVKVLEKLRPLMATDLGKAESLLRKEIETESSAVLDFTLGGILFQQDRMPEALACYRTAVAKFPSFRRAWRNLGLIHARDGAYEQAIEAFTRMIELGGGDSYSYGLLGFAHAAREDYQPAEAAYRNALLLQPESTEWRLGLARCVLRQSKYEDAASLLDALIARNPGTTELWRLQAETYLSMGRPLDAAKNLEAIDRLGAAGADSLHALGDIYVRERLPELASRAYLRAVDVEPEQPPARAMRSAEMLAAIGATRPARELAARVRDACGERMEESERRKLLGLEARLAMAEGEASAETIALLEEMARLDPLDGDVLMLLGQHYARAGEPDRAMLYYERAASLESHAARARIRHAQVLVGMARYADAVPLLRRAQETEPREDVARYLEQVERLARSRR